MNNRFLPFLLRFCSAVVAIAAIGLFLLQLRQAMVGGPIDWPRLIFPGLITISLSLILAGIADAIVCAAHSPDELSRALSRVQQHIADMQRRVDDVAVATDRLSRTKTAPPPPPPPMHVTAQLPPGALDPVVRAINEVRELALLTDEERHERLSNMEQERKRMLVREVIDDIERQRWGQGRMRLDTLDREHPNDVEVKRLRGQFEDARRNAEDATVTQMRDQVDNYIAIGAWDQAHQASTKLLDDFPGNVEAQRIVSRVTRERDIHIETSVARMVEEIRHDIDRRLWRRALMHAQRLIERFADHPKTQRVREQLHTLQQNAEIEERQELEVRIQELIRSHKFPEAIELSEEMLSRFPNSPQAEAIESILPRIRQLANEPEAPAAS